ncbi:hypothetical protein [Pseudoalteromonas rubra]|uniref:Uncharacterized protein n=1 Tax=Pseudoalteromonas rubra TaxID=43658 RepID=A0A5S3WR53_9GAMM|nr:hypothetical protein [Pseudoalteromonas rubra]TMP31318.1 hypothetical protein CWB98_22695 [Pseudoalteromonas rubra]
MLIELTEKSVELVTGGGSGGGYEPPMSNLRVSHKLSRSSGLDSQTNGSGVGLLTNGFGLDPV